MSSWTDGKSSTLINDTSLFGSKYTIVPSNALPLPFTRTVGDVTPATTCALVMIKSGPTTNPEPVSRVLQAFAFPSTFTTESRAASTPGASIAVSSGADTAGAKRTSANPSGNPDSEI